MTHLDHPEEFRAVPVKELFAFLADLSARPEAAHSEPLRRLAEGILAELGAATRAMTDIIGRAPSPEELLLSLLHDTSAHAEAATAVTASTARA